METKISVYVYFLVLVYLRGFLPLFGEGTFSHFFRAFERPIAIACFRLVTISPVFPDFSFPCLYSCIAFFTNSRDFFEYFLGIFYFLKNKFPVVLYFFQNLAQIIYRYNFQIFP
jgi:hypothetical protein